MASIKEFLLLFLLIAIANGNDFSCKGRCGDRYDRHMPCSCNEACVAHGDCCQDYTTACGGSAGISDKDLTDFSEKLFAFKRPKALNSVSVNFQTQSSFCGKDNAGAHVYSVGDEAGILRIPTVAKLIPLLDNYVADVRKAEKVTPQEKQEEQEFMDAVMKTPEMQEAFNLVQEKGVFKGSFHDFSAHVHKVWFGLYDRDGTSKRILDSSAFEHVFVGEIKNGQVSGQHNWVAQYLQEKAGKINYKGWIEKGTYQSKTSATAYGLTSVYDWNGYPKCIGGSLIATTPELEMALATVCFMARSEKECRLTFNSKELFYTTFPMRLHGYDYIGTAYPELSRQ